MPRLLLFLNFLSAFQLVSGKGEDLIRKLPICGQGCLSDQLKSALGFGCESDHIRCLCETPDFDSAIQGCSHRTCTNSTERSTAINNIRHYCSGLMAQSMAQSSTVSAGKVTMTRTLTPVSFVFVTTSTPDNRPSFDLTQVPISVSDSATTVFPIPSTFIANTSAKSPSSSSTANPSARSSTRHVSMTDKIGVGLGVPIGVLCGCVLGGLLIYRCRKRKHDSYHAYQIASQQQGERHALTEVKQVLDRELTSNPTSPGEGWTSSATSSPIELPSQHVPQYWTELPADALVTQKLKGDNVSAWPAG